MAAPRRERGSADGPVSVERIEEAAVRLFGEKSYSVVGMRDISEAVGILPGSLYVHIRKKEDLLLRIVERGIRNYLDVIETAATSSLPAPDRLRGAIVAYMRVLARSLPQTRVAFHQWIYLSPPGQERVIELRRQYEDLFSAIVADGIAKQEFRPVPHPRIAVLAIIGMLNSAAEWFAPDGDLSAEEVGQVLADSALTGLARAPEAETSGTG